MAAHLPLVRDLKEDLFGFHVQGVAVGGESGDVLYLGRWCAVEEVDPPVRLEVGIEGYAQQAVLVAAVDRDLCGDFHGAVLWVVELHRAAQLDVEDTPVGGDGELHRVGGVVVQRDLLEGRLRRGPFARLTAVAFGGARRPLDAAEEVPAQLRLVVVFRLVAQRGVPGPAAVVVGAPGDRVVVAHGVRSRFVRRLVQRGEDVDVLTGVGGEVVPLVLADPGGKQSGGRRMCGVLYPYGRLLELVGAGGVALEERAAHEIGPPGPVRLVHVRRRVQPDESSAALDVALERVPLPGVEGFLTVGEEGDGLVPRQPFVGEDRGILCLGHGEAVFLAELFDGREGGRDRVVPEAGRLVEEQHVVFLLGVLCRAGGHSWKERDQESHHHREQGISMALSHGPLRRFVASADRRNQGVRWRPADSPARKDSPSTAIASWLGASARQIEAAVAIVSLSPVNDSITSGPR